MKRIGIESIINFVVFNIQLHYVGCNVKSEVASLIKLCAKFTGLSHKCAFQTMGFISVLKAAPFSNQ